MEGREAMSTPSLEERIATALVDDIKSPDVAALIAETEAAIREADTNAKAERIKGLDLLASPDADNARQAMQAAEFARDRLQAALPRLEKRYCEVVAAEEFSTWLPLHEAAKMRRDALSSKLRDRYIPFVNEFLPLLLEIEEADREVRRVNEAAPRDGAIGTRLHSVEEEARGPETCGANMLSIIKHLKLPSWEPSSVPVWPPYRPIDPALIAPVAGGDPRLYTGDWWQVGQERESALREQAERETAEREAKARANWRGPRWWEGERA
jgi:hypothetical protein